MENYSLLVVFFGKITKSLSVFFNYFLNDIFIIITVMINSINTQYISNEPLDQYTYPAKSIIFQCTIESYSPETDLIEWCKNNFCTWGRPLELSDGRLQYKSLSRYFITGNRNKGTHHFD
jgi:hypothetical protein